MTAVGKDNYSLMNGEPKRLYNAFDAIWLPVTVMAYASLSLPQYEDLIKRFINKLELLWRPKDEIVGL